MKKLKAGKDHIGVGGGVLIVNDENETLLLRRSAGSKNERGYWQKPGGAVEYGERVADSMEREVREETGLGIKIFGYLPHTDHIIKKDGQHWVAFNYLGRIIKGRPKIMEPEKHDGLRWFNMKKLPPKVNQTTKESVKNYLQGKFIKLR